MSKPLDEMFEQIRREAKGASPFKPCAWYNSEGDALEIYLSPEPHLAERVGPLFTVFVDPQNRERVLGLAIKNIKRHFGDTGISQVVLQAGRASVQMLVFGALLGWAKFNLARAPETKSEPPMPSRIAEILEKVGEEQVTVENLEAVGSR